MVNLRRRMMKPHSPIELIYELSEPTNVANYNTGIQLLNGESWTILCEATFKNHPWTGSQSIWGMVGSRTTPRLGTARGYDDYRDDEVYASSVNRYTAAVWNDSDSALHCSSLISQTNAVVTKRFVHTFDALTNAFRNWSTDVTNDNRWWTVGPFPSTDATVGLNLRNAGSTVNIFKIYKGIMAHDDIIAFVTGGS